MRRLTPRQRDIAYLIGHGYENKEIAKILFVEISTLDYHIVGIREAIGLASYGTSRRTTIYCYDLFGKKNIGFLLNPTPQSTVHKTCPVCEQIKPKAEFNKNRSAKDKLDYRCRECRKRTNKEYIANLKGPALEKRRAYAKNWAETRKKELQEKAVALLAEFNALALR